MGIDMLKPDEDLTIKRGRERNIKRLEDRGAKWVDDGVKGQGKRLSVTPDQLESIKKYGYSESAQVNGHEISVMCEPGTREYYVYAGGRVELNDDPDLARTVFKYAKALAEIEDDELVLTDKVDQFAEEQMNKASNQSL